MKSEDCIKYFDTYKTMGVYVLIIMEGNCPASVDVSIPFHPSFTYVEVVKARKDFIKYTRLTNEWLRNGLPACGIVRFLLAPPNSISGIVGKALISAMDR